MTHRHILVVDNDPGILGMLGLALGTHGFVVTTASSGPEAVRTYERERGRIGLVLLDVRMPGMDGPQTLAALRGVDPSVRCCFMTTGTGDYSREDLLGMGAAEVFEKPFGLADLARRLGGVADGVA